MNFLKTYWWAIALIIIAFLIYWFNFRKDANKKETLDFVCNNTKAEWTAKMSAKITAMQTDPYWQQEAQKRVAEGKSVNLQAAYENMADWSLRTQGKECNPNYPLNSLAQFGV